MNNPQSLCVFCGSATGNDPRFQHAAITTGNALVARGITLIYGGASVGLMGVLADTVLAGGGKVIGVIPESEVIHEVAHPTLTQLIKVGSMHERKAVMGELADAFLALPGGLGTLEELFEVLTWAQLKLHAKPVGLLNVAGYYDPLLAFLNTAVASSFVRPAHRALLSDSIDPEALLDKLLSKPPLS